MDILYNCGKLEVKTSTIPNGGFGVFATDDIKVGEILEECRYLAYSKAYSLFEDYRFWVNSKKENTAIVLGTGSIYNSSKEKQNAWWVGPSSPKIFKFGDIKITRIYLDSFTFFAIKDIKKGDEIFTYYGYKVKK
tara:strand:+ start:187 stop:591 length:405 start_codon:yes stop_codon:yes gene_type:complete